MNARIAERLGGTLLLRFEDIDTARCRPDYKEAALADLAWLGIRWQEPVWHQSERFPVYAAALERLEAEGLVYPCFCTRGTIARDVADRPDWPRDPDGSPLYPGTCRNLSAAVRADHKAAGARPAWRLNMQKAVRRCAQPLDWIEYRESLDPIRIPAEPEVWGDAVLGRRDIPTSYHIAVVTDDAAQGVTNVVRGMDLFPATGLHRLVQTLLDLPQPAYHHHALMRDGAGEKLAKSKGATALVRLRSEGATPEDIIAALRSKDARGP